DLLRSVARRLCQRLVQGWLSKDGTAVRKPAQTWIEEQMAARELGADCFIRRLDEECVKALKAPTEGVFHNILKPLTDRLVESAEKAAPARGGWLKSPKPVEAPDLPAEAYAEPLKALAELLGKPGDETEVPCKAAEALRVAAERLTAQWGQALT